MGVLVGIIFSHTPDEAKSGGLAKACVPGKKYSVSEKIELLNGIKSLSNILTKHLTKSGDMWIDYLPFATLAQNTYNSPNLNNYSPYVLVFRRKPKLLLDLETDPDIKVAATYKEYYERLEQRLKYLQKVLSDFKMRHLTLLNKDREYFQYNSGDLVI